MKYKLLLCGCLLGAVAFKAPAQTRPVVNGQRLLAHPRLLFTAKDEARVRRLLPRSPLLQQMKASLLRQVAAQMSAPLPQYGADPKTGNMLTTARNEISRLLNFALAYRLTGDALYLSAVERELKAVCAWPDWWPRHFLEPTAISVGVSLAYDWTYDALSASTRDLVERTLCTHALEYAVRAYKEPKKSNWAAVSSNWNTACNGGMLLAALAIADRDTAVAGNVVRNVLKYLPLAQKSYGPDGVAYEGSFYYGYAGTYFCMILDALRQNFGTDFGLLHNAGMDRLAASYLKLISPAGRVFSFADGGEREPFTEPVYFYYSRNLNTPEAAPFYRTLISRILQRGEGVPVNFFYLAIPWYDGTCVPHAPARERLSVLRGPNNIVVLQGNDPSGRNIWLAAKGGWPLGAHQHLDMGTFELEADSVMWFADMGREQSSLPGYWDSAYRRWHYFREGCLSHNVCTVNGRFQNPKARAQVTGFSAGTAQPWASMDLTAAYPAATSAQRTFTLHDNRTVVVTDSFVLRAPWQQVVWNAMTQADVKVDGNRAVLTQGGKTFYATILAPKGARFSTKTVQTEQPDIETPCTGWRHLQIVIGSDEGPCVVKVRLSSTLG